MQFKLLFTTEAKQQYADLGAKKVLEKRLKAVKKTLGYLTTNPRHQSLNTHKHTLLSKQYKRDVFECYAENNTPAAYRIFWYYGPDNQQITIIAITPHP